MSTITDEQAESAWIALAKRCAATPVSSPEFAKVTRMVLVGKDDLRAALEAAERVRREPSKATTYIGDPPESVYVGFFKTSPEAT